MTLPASLATVLPTDTVHTWETIGTALPDPLYLGDGTALTVHLNHRVSHDLDFFYHRAAVDLDALQAQLNELGPLAVTHRAPGTLNCIFSKTKLQFLHADEAKPQHQLEPTTRVAGINVAGVGDIVAMKLKVIPERGELRDYFDLKAIEINTGRTVEEGLALYIARYQLPASADTVEPIVRALGYLADVDDDVLVPESKDAIASYWAKRQPEIVRSLGRLFGNTR